MSISFRVRGPIPRYAPYKKFRSRLYVPADVRAWRNKIAATFKRVGGRRPTDQERMSISVHFQMVDSHADLDSIFHSLQDAVTKDALQMVDKEVHIGRVTHKCGEVTRKASEYVEIIVDYETPT